jgi:hypothetical protein
LIIYFLTRTKRNERKTSDERLEGVLFEKEKERNERERT